MKRATFCPFFLENRKFFPIFKLGIQKNNKNILGMNSVEKIFL